MNRENVQAVRDRIAALKPHRFSMVHYFGRVAGLSTEDIDDRQGTNREMLEGSCGSCACIAGHALVELAPDEPAPHDAMTPARKLLGLSAVQAGRLFEPNNNDPWFEVHRGLRSVTQAEAVRVLDHLLETGRVSWRILAKPAQAAEQSNG